MKNKKALLIKKNISLNIILKSSGLYRIIIIFFVLIFGLTLLYLQSRSLNKRVSSAPSTLVSSGIFTPSPSPIPSPSPRLHSFSSSRQQIEFETAKQIDDPRIKESYLISFDKVTNSSTYKITNDDFATLIIFDDTYEFSLSIPKEGFSTPFKATPPTQSVNTKYLGTLTRLTNPFSYSDINPIAQDNEKTEYYYTSNFDTSCSQWSPIPASCSSLLVATKNNIEPGRKINSLLVCKTSESLSSSCDQLVSTLEIKLK